MRTLLTSALAATVTITLSGCHVDANSHGGKKSVDMNFAGASMKVKTDKTPSADSLGVALYPGATVVDDKDAGADVDMSFGDFRLRVKTAKFTTVDSSDKVKSFYMGELGHYGDVIECHDGKPVGEHAATGQGLTCEEKDAEHHHQHFNLITDGTELKAGSKRHQHIVAIRNKGTSSEINIVALDLPGKPSDN